MKISNAIIGGGQYIYILFIVVFFQYSFAKEGSLDKPSFIIYQMKTLVQKLIMMTYMKM